jgi:hypothetical protein
MVDRHPIQLTKEEKVHVRDAALRLRKPVPQAAQPKEKKPPKTWRKIKLGMWMASGTKVVLESTTHPTDSTWEVTSVTSRGVRLTPISLLPAPGLSDTARIPSVFLADTKWEKHPEKFRKVKKARSAKNLNLKLGA